MVVNGLNSGEDYENRGGFVMLVIGAALRVFKSLFLRGATNGAYGTLALDCSFYTNSYFFRVTCTINDLRLLSQTETSLMKDSVILLNT